MKLKLITPEKLILDDVVYSVTLPGIAGEMTILPGHAMLVSELVKGNMHYKKFDSQDKEQSFTYKIENGLVEVQKDNVVVLTTKVSRSDQ